MISVFSVSMFVLGGWMIRGGVFTISEAKTSGEVVSGLIVGTVLTAAPIIAGIYL